MTSNKIENISKRNSNIELLRIIAMFMIVLSHYSIHSGVITTDLPIGFNRFLFESANFGNIGVIIFVIITGYFSIDSKEPFKLKKLLLLILETMFYSISIFIIFVLLGKETFSIKILVHNAFPITYQIYWFMSAYVILYILIPYLNIMLNSCNKKQLSLLLGIIFILSILNTINNRLYYINELIQIIMFYIIGAYLKRFEPNILKNKKNNIFILLLTLFIMMTSVIIIDLIKIKLPNILISSDYLYGRFKITSLLFSISLFLSFKNSKPINNKLINIISQATLGVYLIHENPSMINVLWNNILHVSKYAYSKTLIIHMIISVIIIYFICSIIDLIRKYTIEKLDYILYSKIENQIYKIKDKIMLKRNRE